MLGDVFLESEGEPVCVERGADAERDVVGDDGAGDGDGDRLAALLELPARDGAVGADAVPDAAVRSRGVLGFGWDSK